MKSLKQLAVIFLGLGVLQTAHADTERLVLEMGDAAFSGRSTIFLKQEIQRRYPRVQLQRAQLEQVRIVAKSQHGQGVVELEVDGRSKDRSAIMGNPSDYRSSLPRTWDRIDLRNFGSSQGTWQLGLQGNIKVRRVVVLVEVGGRPDRPGRPGRLHYAVVGTERVDKIVEEMIHFNVNMSGIQELRLVADRADIDVQRVNVKYGNGQVEALYNLQGNLDDGEIKTAYIGGRNVVSVTIKAVSKSLFGGRGDLTLQVGY